MCLYVCVFVNCYAALPVPIQNIHFVYLWFGTTSFVVLQKFLLSGVNWKLNDKLLSLCMAVLSINSWKCDIRIRNGVYSMLLIYTYREREYQTTITTYLHMKGMPLYVNDSLEEIAYIMKWWRKKLLFKYMYININKIIIFFLVWCCVIRYGIQFIWYGNVYMLMLDCSAVLGWAAELKRTKLYNGGWHYCCELFECMWCECIPL